MINFAYKNIYDTSQRRGGYEVKKTFFRFFSFFQSFRTSQLLICHLEETIGNASTEDLCEACVETDTG